MSVGQSSTADASLVSSLETSWSLIEAAADRNGDAREAFARRYLSPIRAYLFTRWRGTAYLQYLDDAIQEVFLACFRAEGPLRRADPRVPSGFRPFLYAVVRNVARKLERRVCTKRFRTSGSDFAEDVQADEASLSVVYDRSWAKCLMRQAAEHQLETALKEGGTALRRVELLRLRFQQELPIRDIADRWKVSTRWLHHEYAKARQEFKAALLHVIAQHHSCSAASQAELEREGRELLSMLR